MKDTKAMVFDTLAESKTAKNQEIADTAVAIVNNSTLSLEEKFVELKRLRLSPAALLAILVRQNQAFVTYMRQLSTAFEDAETGAKLRRIAEELQSEMHDARSDKTCDKTCDNCDNCDNCDTCTCGKGS